MASAFQPIGNVYSPYGAAYNTTPYAIASFVNRAPGQGYSVDLPSRLNPETLPYPYPYNNGNTWAGWYGPGYSKYGRYWNPAYGTAAILAGSIVGETAAKVAEWTAESPLDCCPATLNGERVCSIDQYLSEPPAPCCCGGCGCCGCSSGCSCCGCGLGIPCCSGGGCCDECCGGLPLAPPPTAVPTIACGCGCCGQQQRCDPAYLAWLQRYNEWYRVYGQSFYGRCCPDCGLQQGHCVHQAPPRMRNGCACLRDSCREDCSCDDFDVDSFLETVDDPSDFSPAALLALHKHAIREAEARGELGEEGAAEIDLAGLLSGRGGRCCSCDCYDDYYDDEDCSECDYDDF